jgi:hypothetical protein
MTDYQQLNVQETMQQIKKMQYFEDNYVHIIRMPCMTVGKQINL